MNAQERLATSENGGDPELKGWRRIRKNLTAKTIYFLSVNTGISLLAIAAMIEIWFFQGFHTPGLMIMASVGMALVFIAAIASWVALLRGGFNDKDDV